MLNPQKAFENKTMSYKKEKDGHMKLLNISKL